MSRPIRVLAAATICALYKSRWQIELFFKWIKQHLRIKAFYGTGENADKTRLWIANSVYLPVRHRQKRLDLPGSLYTLLQALSVTLGNLREEIAMQESRMDRYIPVKLRLNDLAASGEVS